MPTINQNPAYNLKVVLRETGLNAAVLRAWERRYGLPTPKRTPGGHRLYSQSDIETLKWLMARQAEGLSISRAVAQWKEMTTPESNPFFEAQQTSKYSSLNIVAPPDASLEIFRRSWLEACLAFDEVAADQALNQAFSLYPVEKVCTEVLQRGMSDMGEKYYRREASVQQEHFASALAMRRLDMLIAATPPPTRLHTILVGCPPDEWHTFSVLLLSLLLRRRGLEVVYLGANIPAEQLEETAVAIQPDLIVLVAQQLTTAAKLLPIALVLKEKGIPLAYGGRIFNQVPEIRQHIPAHFLGESIDIAVRTAEQLALAPSPVPETTKLDESQRERISLYREQRPLIEMALFETLLERNLPTEHIDTANYFLGNALTAALELGEVAYLTVDIDWLHGLLTARNIRPDRIIPYLDAYGSAVCRVLGEHSTPIAEWLDTYTAQHSPKSQ